MPEENFQPAQLVGKRVAFRDDDAHAGCWHFRVGLKAGVVIKVGPTLAQKAEMIGAEQEVPEELRAQDLDVIRIWVRADPCALFPRGCEAAVEPECVKPARD